MKTLLLSFGIQVANVGVGGLGSGAACLLSLEVVVPTKLPKPFLVIAPPGVKCFFRGWLASGESLAIVGTDNPYELSGFQRRRTQNRQ